jgi:transcriptional regulator with XRE-family HTH domain
VHNKDYGRIDKMGTVRENIAANIKRHREGIGLSQRELAAKLGVGYSSVGNWELGLNSPSIELLIDMCELFDIKITTMYGLSNEAEKKAQRMYANYLKAPESMQRVVDTALELNLQIPEPEDQPGKDGQ